MKNSLLDALKTRPLVGDGAMGTQLMLAGLEQGGCGEAWNLTQPERVLAIQRRYADAGADCLITNTFGGSRIMLRRHGQADDVGLCGLGRRGKVRDWAGRQQGKWFGRIHDWFVILSPAIPRKRQVGGAVSSLVYACRTFIEEAQAPDRRSPDRGFDPLKDCRNVR